MLNARLVRDLKNLARSPPPGISGAYDGQEDGLAVVRCVIDGPPDSPYEGGSFRLTLWVSPRFPHEPPLAKFTTRIYHPNIDSEGRICLDTLKSAPTISVSRVGYWNPDLSLSAVLLTLQSLLASPNPEDGLDQTICSLHMNNYPQFWANAVAYTKRYAPHISTSSLHSQAQIASLESSVASSTLEDNMGVLTGTGLAKINSSKDAEAKTQQVSLQVEPTFLLAQPRRGFLLSPKLTIPETEAISQSSTSSFEPIDIAMPSFAFDSSDMSLTSSPRTGHPDEFSILGRKRTQRTFSGAETAADVVLQLSARRPSATWTWDSNSNTHDRENVTESCEPTQSRNYGLDLRNMRTNPSTQTLTGAALTAQCERNIKEEAAALASLDKADLLARMRGKRIFLGVSTGVSNSNSLDDRTSLECKSSQYPKKAISSVPQQRFHYGMLGCESNYLCSPHASTENNSRQANSQVFSRSRESMTSPPPQAHTASHEFHSLDSSSGDSSTLPQNHFAMQI